MKKQLLILAALSFGQMGYAEKRSLTFDFDVSFTHNDHGFEKTDAHTPAKTTTLGQTAYLNFMGQTEDHINYHVYMSLTADKLSDAVEVAKASKKFSEMFSLHIGKDLINQGGYDNKNANFATIIVSPYTANHNPFAGYATMMKLVGNLGAHGQVTLMLTDDVVADGTNGFLNTAQKQPATLLEWTAQYGMVSPLVQIVPYDNGKSMQTAIGVGVEASGAMAYIDYLMDSRTHMVAGKEEKTTHTSIVLDVTYDAGYFVPFFKFASYDAKQPGTDQKGNSVPAANAGFVMDDNGQSMTVGTNLPGVSSTFTPYVAFVSHSAKNLKSATSDTTESKTQTSLVFGFGGTI